VAGPARPSIPEPRSSQCQLERLSVHPAINVAIVEPDAGSGERCLHHSNRVVIAFAHGSSASRCVTGHSGLST
jgi:hypothetical protein